MKNAENKRKFKVLFPYYLLALAIIVTTAVVLELEFFLSFVGRIWSILTPFFYGFLIAYIVNIPCSAVQKLLAKTKRKFILKRQRMFSVLIVALIFAAIVALSLNWVIPAVVNSISFFIENAEAYWNSIVQLVENFNELELFGWYISVDSALAWLEGLVTGFSFEDLMSPINAIVDVGAAIFTVVIALIASIYVMIEKDKIKSFFGRLLKVYTSAEVGGAILSYTRRLNKNFRQYIRVQTIDGMILGTLAAVQLAIIGSPYALILGIMLGVVNYVPYFGSIIGTIIAVLVVTFTQGFTMGLIVAATLFVTQQIDANFIQPRLMSGAYSLSPLLVIISITTGGAIAGILGMIAAIPIIAVLKEMYESITEYYERKKFGAPDKGGGGT